jgi:hypothetical protein
LLFRWFVGLNMDDPVWDVTVFTKNRQRLLAGDIADAFFAAVLKQARSRDLLSDEHFTVDGTLLEAWAGQKSFRRVDDNHQPPINGTGEGSNPTVNFHREKRSNQTHCSTTDPDAMLSRKSRGGGAVLAYRGHLLTENRNGLMVSTLTTRAYGSAERDAALLMAEALHLAHTASHSERTRVTTPTTSSPNCVIWRLPHTSRRMTRIAAAPWMSAQHAMRGTKSVRRNTNESKKCSAG